MPLVIHEEMAALPRLAAGAGHKARAVALLITCMAIKIRQARRKVGLLLIAT
jgi:hypothetical protein